MSAVRDLLSRPRWAELLLATAVCVLGLGEIWVPFNSRQGSGSVTSATVGVVLAALALLWCRREPLVAALSIPVVWGLIGLLAPTYVLFYGTMLPLEISVFMVARFGHGRAPLYGALVAAASLLGVDLFEPLLQEPGEIGFHWTVTTLVWSAGFGLRTLDRRAKVSIRRAIEAEVGAAEQAMRAVLQERALIARELHDIVAHAISSMIVQVGAAEAAADDADYVRHTMASVRSTGNEGLAEMRRLLSMLRVEDEAPLAPQPRIEALPALIEQTSTDGPPTTLTVTGSPRPLPAGLDLAVYRIIQEALTNVRRHSCATHCEVSLDYGPDRLTLTVLDNGRGAVGGIQSSGHGLVGMRERVGLYGGDLTAEAPPGGGFEIKATLPVAP